ncbi:MAG TPA: NAD-dependent epimerase/dehydratase family protein, partial [Polyangia bacterium]|nr:NAD-dependent epimerase/dehydratase family protein [Polyangia bacterium]
MKSNAILVTGGTGFLGSHLVKSLAADPAVAPRLRVLVNSSTPAWLRELGVRLVEGSVTSPESVAKAVEGVSEIYHLAGFVSHLASDAHRMYSVHVDGTRLVCDAAVKAGVRRIVMAS